MIRKWSQGPADENMTEQLLVTVMETVRKHPWWKAPAALAVKVLEKSGIRPPARIADVGCGWGTNLERLEKIGYHVTGLDISRRVLSMIDREGRDLVEADLTQEFPPESLASYDACLVL